MLFIVLVIFLSLLSRFTLLRRNFMPNTGCTNDKGQRVGIFEYVFEEIYTRWFEIINKSY